MHGPIPSALMLASRVTFVPQLRGTLANARSPLRDQAYKGANDVFEPISSTNTSRWGPISPATSTRQATLKNSSRSAAPTDLFSTPPRTAQQPRDSGLAHSQPGHAAQVLAPLREGGGRSLLEIHLQEPPRAIVGLRGSTRAPLRAQRSPFAHCLGVAFERRDAHTNGASDFDGGHGAFFGLDYLLAQVLIIGVHAPMVRQAQPYCKPL